MYFRGRVDVCTHLASLTNIFIREGAEIKLKLSLHHMDRHFGKITAKPTNIISSHLLPSTLGDDYYLTRPMRIYGSLEQAPISDTVLWTTYIDAFEAVPQLTITCQLLICKNGEDLPLKTIHLQSNIMTNSYLPIYFDQFGFVSSVEGEIHTTISKYEFHSNESMVKELMLRIQKEKAEQHIKKYEMRVIPLTVRSLSEFVIMITHDNKKNLFELLNRFVVYLGNSSMYLSNTISEIEQSLVIVKEPVFRMSLPSESNSVGERKAKKKIFQMNESKTGVKTELDPFSQLERASSTIMGLWEHFVQLITKGHYNYYLDLRKKYFISLNSYYLNKNIIFNPSITLYNQPLTPIHQVETNNYQITIDDYCFKPIERKHTHLIIYVHGINAHSFDMESLRNMFKFMHPKVHLHLSKVNEERTNDKIAEQGQRLSIEIKNLIRTKYAKTNTLKVSFLCHSMGGLIARAALEYLDYYKQNVYAFISLCTPHLGQLLHPSTFIKTTIFLLNKFSPSESMLELNMQDGQPEDSYVYKLSQSPEISWFKHMVLVNVNQDNIVPRCSARIEQPHQSMVNMPQYRLFHKMVYNIKKNLKNTRVTKIEFRGSGSSDFDSFIGKSQHIELIKDMEAIRVLNMILYKLF